MQPLRRKQKGRQQERYPKTVVGIPHRTVRSEILRIDVEIKRLRGENADIVARDVAGLDIKTAAAHQTAGHDRVVRPVASRPAMGLVQHPKSDSAARHRKRQRRDPDAGVGSHVETLAGLPRSMMFLEPSPGADRLLRQKPPVNRQDRAGDERCFVRGKEQDRLRHLARLAQSAHRMCGFHHR